MDDDCEYFVEEEERYHIYAHEPHCAQPKVDESLVIPATELADENLVIPTTKFIDDNLVIVEKELVDENFVIPSTEFVDDNLVIPTTELADDNFVNQTIEPDDDSEAFIGAINVMVNPTIQFADVRFDEDLLPNDELLQMMQQKHHIDMMLFNETNPLESRNQVEENLFTVAQVSEEVEDSKKE